MSNLRNIGRLAGLVGLALTLSACHFYAPYYGFPRPHGYHGHSGHGHGGHGHGGQGHGGQGQDGQGQQDQNPRPPYW